MDEEKVEVTLTKDQLSGLICALNNQLRDWHEKMLETSFVSIYKEMHEETWSLYCFFCELEQNLGWSSD